MSETIMNVPSFVHTLKNPKYQCFFMDILKQSHTCQPHVHNIQELEEHVLNHVVPEVQGEMHILLIVKHVSISNSIAETFQAFQCTQQHRACIPSSEAKMLETTPYETLKSHAIL